MGGIVTFDPSILARIQLSLRASVTRCSIQGPLRIGIFGNLFATPMYEIAHINAKCRSAELGQRLLPFPL